MMERNKAAMALNSPFTVNEIINAITNINRRASPGVDGIPTQCIKEAWVFDNNGKPSHHIIVPHLNNNNNNKRPLTPKSMPPAGDEHAKLKI